MSTRERLVLASGNAGKLAELRALLDNEPLNGRFDLHAQSEFGVADIDETGLTFIENALLKARHAAGVSGLPALADDSGIEVDAFDGRPGVLSARYGGEGLTDAERNALMLRELAGVPTARRTARYRAVIAIAGPDGREATVEGTVEGIILESPRGDGGFGYDPIFEPLTEEPGGRTVGQLTSEEKNRVSHRALAALAMRERLLARGY